jgi:hypothetical protein
VVPNLAIDVDGEQVRGTRAALAWIRGTHEAGAGTAGAVKAADVVVIDEDPETWPSCRRLTIRLRSSSSRARQSRV